jgi:CHAT domain-containing protein
LIWKPIESDLVSTQKIYYAPSGLLYQVNIAALQTDNHELLIDQYQLFQVNTTGFINNRHNYTISPSDKIILYGGIIYDADSSLLKKAVYSYKNLGVASRSLPDDLDRGGGFPYLPATMMEVTQILNLGKARKFSIQTRKGLEASEESIKALEGKNSPGILHIASHGFFFPNPKKHNSDVLFENQRGSTLFKQSENPLFRSGLVFAGAEIAWKGKAAYDIEDGILTAYEISNMYLPNTRLVVLSACETGLGDIKGNEGVYGLQRSFNMAGVQNLIMSLWKVPDNESAEFMTLLYKNIFAGETIEDAFSNTQTIMKNKYRNEPYKWAAWILVR